MYYGNVEVLQEGKLTHEIPIEIDLLPQYLPDENHTNIWLFSSGVADYFPGLPKEYIDDMIKFEAHRHRIDLAGGFDINQSLFNQEAISKYKPYLDGTAFTPANGYHGTGEGIGEKIFPIGMYGSPVYGGTKDTMQQQANLGLTGSKGMLRRLGIFGISLMNRVKISILDQRKGRMDKEQSGNRKVFARIYLLPLLKKICREILITGRGLMGLI
jgi:hypothetical protein